MFAATVPATAFTTFTTATASAAALSLSGPSLLFAHAVQDGGPRIGRAGTWRIERRHV